MARAGASTTITYGSYSFDSQPTPFVTLQQESLNDHGGPADGRWGAADRISIQGFLTGIAGGDDCGTLGPSGAVTPAGWRIQGNLFQAQNSLLNGFGTDFQTLVIKDTDDGDDIVYNGYNCIVRGINFDESPYNGLLPYSIDIDAYNEDYWNSVVSNAMGVLDPEDSYDFDQDPEDEIVKISHTVSARGFNTDSSPNALHNAKTFVHGRTGYKFDTYVGLPKFIEVGTCGSAGSAGEECCFIPVLKTQSESIDRITSTYSITETYEADPSGCSGIILRYSTSLESGIDGDFVRGTIDAEATHSKTGNFSELQEYFNGVDFFSLLTGDTRYQLFNQVPITHSIEENETGRAINFNASYDDNTLFGANNAIYDHGISFSKDEITNVTTATVNGTIKSRGNLQERIQATSDHLSNNVQTDDLYNLANGAYAHYKSKSLIDDFSLRSIPTSHTVSTGVYGEIDVSATFDDKWILESNDGLRDSTYSYSIKAPMQIFKPKAAVNENGLYAIFDTNVISREEFSITAQLVGKHNPVAGQTSSAWSAYLEGKADGMINVLKNSLDDDGARLRLETENVSKSDTDSSISCNYTFSQDKPVFLSESQYKIGKVRDGS